ncbi:class I SAM-dependent methyltransferase [Candidatus Saccharibacteria bacterium]|nr:class I SAM-dependent methyltransferase [Candidatus Saccharibacteria bacterium]
MKDTGERLIPEGHTQSLTYGEHLSRYSAVLELVKDKVVIDIASGAGYGTNLIASKAKHVTGVDYSKEAIEYASNLYKSKNLKFVQGNASNLPFEDNIFDVVVSLETIEHLEDPEKFVIEVKRVLKPEGIFIVSTPNDDEYIEGNEFHLHEFCLKDLEKLVNKYFINSEFYYQGSYFATGLYSKDIFKSGHTWTGPITKTFGQNLSKAIYFQVVASDIRTPKLLEPTVVADVWSAKDDIIRDKERQIDRKKLVKIAEDAEAVAKELQEANRRLSKQLAEIHESKAWKFFEKVRDTIGKPREQ